MSRKNFSLALGAAAMGIVGFLTASAIALADVNAENSLLLNAPAQSEGELPPLPAPADLEASAPELLPPGPVKARATSSNRPFMRPVEPDMVLEQPRETPVSISPSLPAPPYEGPIVYPVSNVKYDTDRSARKLFKASHGTIDTVLVTQNPADGCFYEIPVCLPACCVGEPRVEPGRGLLGRGVVEYCWPCGLEVKVIFRLRGDVKVKYDA